MSDPIKFISHGYDPGGKDRTVAVLIHADGRVEDLSFADHLKRGLKETVRAVRGFDQALRRLTRESSVYWRRYVRRSRHAVRARRAR
jgi:hypothetical protein